MAGYRENGGNAMKLRIRKSCWQQDIRRWEWSWAGIKAAGITLATAWLFYRSVTAVPILIPLWIYYWNRMVIELYQEKESAFMEQFKEAIQSVSASLNTGYSVENAFREAQKELMLQYPQEARISREMQILVRQLRLQIPVEQALEELADRVEGEEIRSFAAVFSMAKRSGADMMAIIEDTVKQIGDKMDVQREIETILAARKYEFKVMTLIPYLIIAYLSVSFPEFMDSLYGTVAGKGVMTICLAVYLGACALGSRIIKIEV